MPGTRALPLLLLVWAEMRGAAVGVCRVRRQGLCALPVVSLYYHNKIPRKVWIQEEFRSYIKTWLLCVFTDLFLGRSLRLGSCLLPLFLGFPERWLRLCSRGNFLKSY